MNKKYAVIGLGRFGKTLAVELAKNGAEVIALDINEDLVEDIKSEVAISAQIDSTDIKALSKFQLEELDAVIVAIGADFESTLLTTVNLMELKVPKLYARAMNGTQKRILKMIGVEHIVAPELEAGMNLADQLSNPGMLSCFKLPDGYEIVEVIAPALTLEKTLQEIDLRNKYNLNLITIRRSELEVQAGKEMYVDHLVSVPKGDTQIKENDVLILIGLIRDVERFLAINA